MSNKHVTVNAGCPPPQILRVHERVVTDGGYFAKPAKITGHNVEQEAKAPTLFNRLENGYMRFCGYVDGLERCYGYVPTRGAAARVFMDELIDSAWFCLVGAVSATNVKLDRAERAIAGRQQVAVMQFVPKFVWARLDCNETGMFVAGLDAKTRADWRYACRLAADHRIGVVMPISVAAAAIRKRIAAEAHLHRPIAQLFSADAAIE